MAGLIAVRRMMARGLAAALLAFVAFIVPGASSQAAEDGAWTGRFTGLAQETVQVWVSKNRFKLFADWPGGRTASADGDIRADGAVRVCGTYERSQQGDNLCIDGRFAGDRFTGRWSVGSGEAGDILLTRSGSGATASAGATAASSPPPPPPAAPPSAASGRATIVAVGDFIMPDGRPNESGRQQLLSHLSRASGSRMAVVAMRPESARADLVATARFLGGEATQTTDAGRMAARALGYNIGSPERLRVTARVQVDLTRVSDGALLSEIGEAGDKIDPGANRESAGAAFAGKAIGEAVQRLVARLTTDRQDFLAVPDTPPPAMTPPATPPPAVVASARSAPPPASRPATPAADATGDKPVAAVGDFTMSDGGSNETGRQLMIAALNRAAGGLVNISGLSPGASRHDFRVTGRNLGAEATVTGTRGGRSSRVNVFKIAIQVQVEMLRVADGMVLTEQVELTDSVAGDRNAVNQQGALLLRKGIERVAGQLANRLSGDRRDFLAVPRPPAAPVVAAARAAAPAPPPAYTEFDRPTRRVIQEDLKTLGLYRGAVDGELGSGSRAAVQAFQRMIGEAPTGALTQEQLDRLKAQAGTKLAALERADQDKREQDRREQDKRLAEARPADDAERIGPVEMEYWNAVKANRTLPNCRAYLERYPQGNFAPLARACVDELEPAASGPAVAAAAAKPPTSASPVAVPPASAPPAAPAASAPLPAALKPPDDPFAAMRAEPRQALVIGNAQYQALGVLRNPVNDARSIAMSLGRVGFKVALLENATRLQMVAAIQKFGAALSRGGVGVFYFAGHGVQVRGANYLMPVDADPRNELAVSQAAVDSGWVLEHFDVARNRFNLMILDACRNNPLEGAFRSASRGLAAVGRAPGGTMIAFATAPGDVAADGEGENGLYTAELLTHIETPGLKVEDVMKRVTAGVRRRSAGQQIPWTTGSLEGDFYFRLP